MSENQKHEKRLPSISMGLDAIFSAETCIESTLIVDNEKNEKNEKYVEHEKSSNTAKILQVPVMDIVPSPFQARQIFSETALTELSESIREHGILQPLLARVIEKNTQKKYELLAGERRFRAAQRIGLATVPMIVLAVDDGTAMAFGLIENIQRHNLNPIEEAKAYERLVQEFQLSHEELSEKLGKSRSHITNLLRLNRLSDKIKADVCDEKITMGHARALLSAPEEKREHIAQWIVSKGWSVRQTELFIKKIVADFSKPVENTTDEKIAEDTVFLTQLREWEKNLNQQYAKVGMQFKIAVDEKGRPDLRVVTTAAASFETFEKLISKILL